jgi:hypothetical protein
MYVANDTTGNDINTIEGVIIHKDYNAEYTQYYIKLNYGKIIVASMLNYYYFLTNDNKVSFFEIGEKVFIK